MELSPTEPWTPQRGRLDFRRTIPRAHRDEWPAIDDWIRDHVPEPHRAAFRTWVEGRIGRPAAEAARRRAGHDLIERVDEFELYRLIDSGGMGVVYEAYDTRLDRTVAVKRIRPGLRLELVARFEEEVRLTARPPHPGIPAVYRSGRDAAGHPYMAMLFVDGEALADRFRRAGREGGALEPLLDVFVRVCQTVGSRHTATPLVVHGDLSPRNVKLDRNGEAVFVLDWGLSRAAGGRGVNIDGGRTGPSGTPGYMAPEQFGGEVTVRTDVFQLGCILCELLTGRPAFADASDEPTAEAARAGLAAALARLATTDRRDLAELARRCLAVNPEERPLTATAVADEILALRVRAEEDRRRAERELERAEAARKVDRERSRRVLVTTVLFVVLFAALLVGGALALWLTERATKAERQATIDRQRKHYSEADRHKMYAFRIMATDFQGTRGEAEQHLRQAVDLLTPLVAERPDEPVYVHALATCRFYQGWLAFADVKSRRTGEAITLLRQAEDGFTAAQTAGWAAEAGFPHGTPAALERDDCRCLRGVVLLAASQSADPADGLATEAFEVFDGLWRELPSTRRPQGTRTGQLALLAQFSRLAADQHVRFQSSYSPQGVAALRFTAQMAAEVEQSRLPWSRGPHPNHPRAVSAAARLAASDGVSDQAVYNAACAFALAAADEHTSASERSDRATTALTHLNRLLSSGYFQGERSLRDLETDTDLNSVREDLRFLRLVAKVRVGQAVGGLAGGAGAFGLRSSDR